MTKKSSRPSYQGQDLVLGKSLSLFFFRVGVRVKSINHKEKKGIVKKFPIFLIKFPVHCPNLVQNDKIVFDLKMFKH